MNAATRLRPLIGSLFAILVLAGCDSGRSSLAASAHAAFVAAGTPGGQIVIVRNGKLLLDENFGVRDLSTKAPVDSQTRFEIGSVTKQITAAAILQLKEMGKLSLDDRLEKYVPTYRPAGNVTIRQLLWQTSGIPDPSNSPGFDRILLTHAGNFARVLSLIRDEPLEFAPGTNYQYSNTNYILLGRIVELVSGTSWQRYVAQHIFAPSGMVDSAFTTDERGMADVATGYAEQVGGIAAAPVPSGDWAMGAGAVISTAGDLAKWDAAFFGGRIISPADVALATTSGRLNDGTLTGYGFGWAIGSYDGEKRIGFNGETLGFNSCNDVYPTLNEYVVVVTNIRGLVSAPIAVRSFDALHPDLAARPAAGEPHAITRRIKELWRSIASGTVNRSQLTPAMNKKWTPQHLTLLKTELAQLGAPLRWTYRGKSPKGNVTAYEYRASFTKVDLNVTMTLAPDGKVSDFIATGS